MCGYLLKLFIICFFGPCSISGNYQRNIYLVSFRSATSELCEWCNSLNSGPDYILICYRFA